MAEFVEVLIVRSLHGSVFLWRDDRIHALALRLFQDRVRVIPLVGDQMIGAQTFDQAASRCAIRCCTLCNKDSDRPTLRINGPMDLCIEPPFVRLMS